MFHFFLVFNGEVGHQAERPLTLLALQLKHISVGAAKNHNRCYSFHY